MASATCAPLAPPRAVLPQSFESSRAAPAANLSACSSLKPFRPLLTRTYDRPYATNKRASKLSVRAASSEGLSAEDENKGTGPFSPESPSGQLLVQLLQNHPHLFSAAVDQELEKLAADREANGEEGAASSAKGNELMLYKRISEVRENERRRAVQEVIYSLIVQRFLTSGSPLLPKIPFIDVDPNIFSFAIKSASSNVKQLESVHSAEALEMVREHLAMILGQPEGIPSTVMEDRVIVSTSKIGVGQIYGASIMYGYFLRRVDQRFQLEKTMKALSSGSEVKGVLDSGFAVPEGSGADAALETKEGSAKPPTKLRAYVSSFDSETLKRTTALRSKESLGVIEDHTEALFGKPQITVEKDGRITLPKDDVSQLTLATMRRLVLEAIAFGSFLWDVESYVDSQYKIVNS